MTIDSGRTMKERMRADLQQALKNKRMDEIKLLRALIGALDNAEAAPIPTGALAEAYDPSRRSAEVERLLLTSETVNAILTREIDERLEAAAEMQRLGQADRAAALRSESVMVRRYLD